MKDFFATYVCQDIERIRADFDKRLNLNKMVQRKVGLCDYDVYRAAYCVEPSFHGENLTNAERAAFESVVQNMVPENLNKQAAILEQFNNYKANNGGFNNPLHVQLRQTYKATPATWWRQYAAQHSPELAELAAHILCMAASTSSAERNWSVHGFIHSKKKNRLLVENCSKLVYLHWNLRLQQQNEGYDSEMSDVFWSEAEADISDDGDGAANNDSDTD